MALNIKDGAGSSTSLKTTLDGSEHVPHHIIDDVVTVTGSVKLDDLPIRITSSTSSPVYVSGTLTTFTGDYAVKVTSSKGEPLFVVSDMDKPVYVTNAPSTPVYTTITQSIPLAISSSAGAPIYVSGTVTANLTDVLTVTSSLQNPVYVATKTGSTNTFERFSVASTSSINYLSAASGTFIMAQSASSRVGLMISNNSSKNLYVAIGDNGYSTTNGFFLSAIDQEPNWYGFILYSSGTYFAEPAFVNLKHSGFFVSASNSDAAVHVVKVE